MVRYARILALALVVVLLALLAPVLSPVVAAPPPGYTIIDLGTLPGFGASYANDLNDANQVTGYVDQCTGDNCGPHSFLYERGQIRDLGAPEGVTQQGSKGIAINSSGQVLAELESSSIGGFIYDRGMLTNVDHFLFLEDLGESGQVIGWSGGGQGTYSWLWQGGTTQLLDSGNRAVTRAYRINARGQIVGEGGSSTNPYLHALLWDGGAPIDLGLLPGGGYSAAYAINDAGDIAGIGNAGDEVHLILWRGGQRLDLGIFASKPADINENDQIVGQFQATSDPGSQHAFLWRDGAHYDLNTLLPADSGWTLQAAQAINNAGYIAGYGIHNGQPRAFLLRPTFSDVPADHPYRAAIVKMADWGIMRGYGDGRFGPDDQVLRAQAAALIARAVDWDAEDWTDVNFPDQGVVDDALWRNVRTLAHYRVALGYEDGTYNPTGEVLHQQVILFIARAMIARNAWVEQADTSPYSNLPNTTEREQADRRAIATYVYYAGAVPDRPAGQAWPDWDQPATRGWFAQVLWQALQSLPGVSPAS
jgi:probable HAF family extracellular repeat protein